ncbi:hypothetical protein BT69DRAFT_696514 [Atractiella rhizophila]|nr:hypothetical protein BT69DRAFT_696514 [Atractiella rhizophila]
MLKNKSSHRRTAALIIHILLPLIFAGRINNFLSSSFLRHCRLHSSMTMSGVFGAALCVTAPPPSLGYDIFGKMINQQRSLAAV